MFKFCIYLEVKFYFGVFRRDVFVRVIIFIIRMGVVGTDIIDVFRYDEGEDLFVCL